MTVSSPHSRHSSLFHQPTQRQHAFLLSPDRCTTAPHLHQKHRLNSNLGYNQSSFKSDGSYASCNSAGINQSSPPVSNFPTLTSIQHWQLRNLICASPSDPNSVYYCFRYEIMSLEIGAQQQQTHREDAEQQKSNYRTSLVQEMPFLPMCFTMGKEWFVSGGNESELAWKRMKYLGTDMEDEDPLEEQLSSGTSSSQSSLEQHNGLPSSRSRMSFSSMEDESSSSSSTEQPRMHRYPQNYWSETYQAAAARRRSPVNHSSGGSRYTSRALSSTFRSTSTNQTPPGRNLVHDANLHTRMLGSCINNSVYLYDDFVSNQTRLLVSSNDCSIKVFTMGDQLRLLETIKLLDPVNYCAVTSNGRLCAALTDHPFIMLFDMRSSYAPCAKFTNIFTDGGFTCSFNLQNTQLAAGSQDGTLAIFDLRNTKQPLCRIKSKQNNSRGAIRSLKYAPNPALDLLIFSEHSNYWHILDTRNFAEIETTEVIGDRETYHDIHIGGLDFSCDSSSVFVGTPQNITRYQIDTIKRRKFGSGSLL